MMRIMRIDAGLGSASSASNMRRSVRRREAAPWRPLAPAEPTADQARNGSRCYLVPFQTDAGCRYRIAWGPSRVEKSPAGARRVAESAFRSSFMTAHGESRDRPSFRQFRIPQPASAGTQALDPYKPIVDVKQRDLEARVEKVGRINLHWSHGEGRLRSAVEYLKMRPDPSTDARGDGAERAALDDQGSATTSASANPS